MVHNINLVGISKTENYFNKKNKKNMPERKEISNTTTINDLKGIPYSYISFKGISNLEDSSFTKSANELISNAKEIAIKNGNDSITPHHIIHAAILILENSNTEDKNFTTIEKLANEFAKHNIFENESEINYFIEITSILKANGLATIKNLPTNKTSNNIDLSEDLKASLKDI